MKESKDTSEVFKKIKPWRRRLVLEGIASGMNQGEAAEAAGTSRITIWYWRQHDPAFADAFELAEKMSLPVWEELLNKCSTKALNDPRYQTSLIFKLKAMDPRYNDRLNLRHEGRIDSTIIKVETDEQAALIDQLALTLKALNDRSNS